jgi:hypothetical protein
MIITDLQQIDRLTGEDKEVTSEVIGETYHQAMEEWGLSFEEVGKLIFATDESELKELPSLEFHHPDFVTVVREKYLHALWIVGDAGFGLSLLVNMETAPEGVKALALALQAAERPSD